MNEVWLVCASFNHSEVYTECSGALMQTLFNYNKRVSQMRAPLAAHREPAWGPGQAAKGATCFLT